MKKIFFYISFILILGACQTSKTLTHKPLPQLTEEQERDFKYNFYEGLRLKEEFLFEESLESLMKSYAINKQDPGLLFEISTLHYALRDKEKALEYLLDAIEYDPDNLWFNMYLMDLHIMHEQYDQAIAVGEKVLKKYPTKESSYTTLIALYKNQKQIDKAIALYDKLERITGVDEKISFDKIFLYLSDGNSQKAFKELDKLITKYPLNYNYRILKGDIYMSQHKSQEAYDVYTGILEDDPQNAFVLISLADYFSEMNEPDKSLEYIILALKNDQVDMEMKFEILRDHIKDILKKDGDIEETENLINLLVEQYPLEEMSHSYHAAFLTLTKRYDEAAKAYESMLTINPTNVQTWMDYMILYFERKDYEQALNIAAKAIEQVDEPLGFYFYTGIIYEIQEDYESAIDTYLKTIALFEENDKKDFKSNIYAHLGDSYMNLQQKDNAFAAYDEAVTIDPDNVFALNNYAYYLSLDKRDLDKAERMSAKTVDKEPKSSTYLDTYAWIFYQQGNYSLAKFYIERAMSNLKEKEGESAGVLYDHYADILWMLGENDDKAHEYWQKAYENGVQTDELILKIENKGWIRE